MRPTVFAVVLSLAACPAPSADPVDDPPAACRPGDRKEATIGGDGGSLVHCGATLEVAAGAVPEGSFALTVVDLPQPLPFGLESAGLAFAYDADVEALAGVSLIVPADRDDRIVRLARHDGSGWLELEPCVIEQDRVGQEAAPGFVYAALREDRAYPENKDGLGDGTITRVLDGVTTVFDVDGSLSHGFFDEDAEGNRTVTLFATLPLPDDHLDTVRLVFAIDSEGVTSMLEISTGSTASVDGFYVWLLPVDATGAFITLAQSEPRIVGDVQAIVRLGEVTAEFTAAVDVGIERYRFPPEGACGFPEG